MYGAVFGDIIGSYYELHPTKEYDFNIFRPEIRFTDDTVMNTAVCDAVLYNDSDVNSPPPTLVTLAKRWGLRKKIGI